MSAKLNVRVDPDDDIIVQAVDGEPTEAEFEELYRLTEQAARQLRDPANIRILTDGRLLKGQRLNARQRAAQMLSQAPSIRLAVWGCSPLLRVALRFLSVAIGRDIRAFRNEQEAREWLRQPGPSHRAGEQARS